VVRWTNSARKGRENTLLDLAIKGSKRGRKMSDGIALFLRKKLKNGPTSLKCFID